MTAILAGKTRNGNFIVTDAMSSNPSDEIRSYKDCTLVDKISTLSSVDSYCSVVGDATIAMGIMNFDWWCTAKNIVIDFEKKDIMQKALDSAETYIKINERFDGGTPPKMISNVYFISREKVFEYVITYVKKKYIIDTFSLFSNNEVILNYAGKKTKVPNFDYPINKIFGKATELIDSEHKIKKQNKKEYSLEYDFNDRFCGVIFSKNKNEKETFYSPFNTLYEAIAAERLTPNEFWKLVKDKEFIWSPM